MEVQKMTAEEDDEVYLVHLIKKGSYPGTKRI